MVQSGKTAWKMEVKPSSAEAEKGSLKKIDFNLSLLVSARTYVNLMGIRKELTGGKLMKYFLNGEWMKYNQ